MIVKLYAHKVPGWLGWIENERGDVIAFIRSDGVVVWKW